MNQYTKNKELSVAFSELAKKFNITIVTATQLPRRVQHIIPDRLIKPENNIIVIDHINLLK